jgi:hypothetical protein
MMPCNIILSIQDIDINQRNVLITHQFVSGSSEMIQSESEMPLSVGGTSQIGVEHFDMFDYVALRTFTCSAVHWKADMPLFGIFVKVFGG